MAETGGAGVRTMGVAGRVGITTAMIALPAMAIALVSAEPWTMSNVGRDAAVVMAGPLQQAWTLVRTTGPVRRVVVLVLFVALPLILVPLYSLRPARGMRALTAIGALLWIVSGFLMLSLRYVD